MMATTWRKTAVKGGAWPDVPLILASVSDIVRWTLLNRQQANHLYMLIQRRTTNSIPAWRGWEDRRDDSDR